MSVGRIADNPINVTHTHVDSVAIGHYTCDECGVETPEPPMSVVQDFSARYDLSTIWPFDHWQPDGWVAISTREVRCHSCASCTAKVFSVLTKVSAKHAAAHTSRR